MYFWLIVLATIAVSLAFAGKKDRTRRHLRSGDDAFTNDHERRRLETDPQYHTHGPGAVGGGGGGAVSGDVVSGGGGGG